jgi:hypothetical protein
MIKRLIEWMINVFEPEDKRKVDFFDQPIEKPKKRTYVRKTRPLPSKATIAKKAVGKKTTTTRVKK